MESKIVIYTDGAYSRLRDVGAWGFIIQYLKFNKEHEEYQLIKEASISEEVLSTTSNRVELQAAIEALNYLNKPCKNITIISDSTYVVNTINRWISNFVKDPTRLNHDLMILLYKAMRRHNNIEAKWVKGHSTNIINQRVNELVQRKAQTWKGK